MLEAIVDTPVPLVVILDDGNTAQFPRATVYESGGTIPIQTLDLDHKGLGRYEVELTLTSVGVYSIVYIVYSDSGHTSINTDYTREAEQVLVLEHTIDDVYLQDTDILTRVTRVLGLSNENIFIDNTEFDSIGQLLISRIRLFDSTINLDLATDGGSESTGLLATYEVEAVYQGQSQPKTYKVKKL